MREPYDCTVTESDADSATGIGEKRAASPVARPRVAGYDD
jgi:hypothetical protein